MKVPNYIKDAITKTAKHNAIACRNSEIVRKWLHKYGLDIESTGYYMIDSFIDCCEYGNNNANEFIKELEALDDKEEIGGDDDDY